MLVRELLERLEAVHGPPPERERLDPVDELVACILSQHTTDATSFPTFDELKRRYPNWSQVAALDAPTLAEVIRPAGLANQKAKTILGSLATIRELTGGYTLAHLAAMAPVEARTWLTQLPGVGPKTATIVLCFSLGMDLLPVDTHVHRVSARLGLIPEKTDANRAHDELLEVVPEGERYRFHMDLIVHGRRICRAPLPSCGLCPVQDLCRWFRLSKPHK